jgi:putative transposase
MARKRHQPAEIVAKLRQVEVLTSPGQSMADAIRSIGVTEVTYDRWRQEFGGLKSHQVKRLKHLKHLKHLEAENSRLRLWLNDGACIRLRAEHRNHVWSYDFVEERTHDHP